MEDTLIEIIDSHPTLKNKKSFKKDVQNMFEQIRQLRMDNREMSEKLKQIDSIITGK